MYRDIDLWMENERIYWAYPIQINISGWTPPHIDKTWKKSWENVMDYFYPNGNWSFRINKTNQGYFCGFYNSNTLNTHIIIQDTEEILSGLTGYPILGDNPEWIYHTRRWIFQIPRKIVIPSIKKWVCRNLTVENNHGVQQQVWDTWGQHIPSIREQAGEPHTFEEIISIEEDDYLKSLPYEQLIENVAEELSEYADPSCRTSLVPIFGSSSFQFNDNEQYQNADS